MTSGVRGQNGRSAWGPTGTGANPDLQSLGFLQRACWQHGAGKNAPHKVAGEIVKFAFFDPLSSGLEC